MSVSFCQILVAQIVILCVSRVLISKVWLACFKLTEASRHRETENKELT